MEAYVCLNASIIDNRGSKPAKDPMESFGGFYSEHDVNPMTGTHGCADGYDSAPIGEPTGCGGGAPYYVYTCYNLTTYNNGGSFIGGFYSGLARNAFTHDFECPPGGGNVNKYTAYDVFTNTHICLNNVY